MNYQLLCSNGPALSTPTPDGGKHDGVTEPEIKKKTGEKKVPLELKKDKR
jgi:hypothetical protein